MKIASQIALNKKEVTRILDENILKFWETKMPDQEYGGFYGRVDGRGIVHKTWKKSIILNSRLLWTFSAVFQHTGKPEHLLLADRAYRYIVGHFLDETEGGVYWMLDHQGELIDGKKQVYAQSFAIYGLTEYHKIRPESNAREYAVQFFELIEKHAFDQDQNGYLEAFDQHWNQLEDVRLSEKDLNADKTMNTHLHILEAYTNLYSVWKAEKLRCQLKNLIQIMLDKFVDDQYHFKLFFNKNWKLLSRDFSYGHDIEGSWLLYQAAEVLDEQDLLNEVGEMAIKMVDASLEGLDVDGGLMNEGDSSGVRDTDKHWWPQAEAMVGLLNAWAITKNELYFNIANDIWSFTNSTLIDTDGEWHWKVSKEGQIDYNEDKAGPWKCPYHNGRAMLELCFRLPS